VSAGRDYDVDPWVVRERALDLDRLAQTESVFSLGNGHIGLRGNLDEGEPSGLPGTYLNGFYETRPLPYAEAGYGYPEGGQTVVDVTNGKIFRLLVDDEPLDLRYGTLHAHERLLDLRTGLLHRSLTWSSPGGRTVRVRSTRMVSLVERAIMGIEYVVEVLDDPARIVVQSELVANEELPQRSGDPRVAAALDHPLRSLEHDVRDSVVYLAHETRRSKLRIATLMRHLWEGPEGTEVSSDSFDDVGRTTFIAGLAPGEELRIVKLVAYGWSSVRSVPALRDQVGAAVAAAAHTGWDGLKAEQRAYLDRYWAQADVVVEGDDEIQQAVRFSMFHVLQAGARAEGRAIPAKGLTGPGYDGHAFWDTETFVLPVLTYTLPRAAADALRWRQSILPAARERAAQLGLEGAAFPWRTIAGEECSAYWPAGTAAFHIGADVADAVRRYILTSGDRAFERATGVELLVATARLWMSLGWFHGASGEFRIDGVTGPDEYSAVSNNNVYTNLMAKRNLRFAADVVGRHPDVASDVGPDEVASWRRAADRMRVPWDAALGVHPQADAYTERERWDFDSTGADAYPLMLHYPYFDLYRRQVVKQADLVMALFACGDEFTDAEKVADFEYYEAVTVRDSSLSAAVQSIVAAETGHLDLAYDYWGEAALMDLLDLEHNTGDGVHIAALAGAWLAAVNGFGGMRDFDDRLRFRPQLPAALTRLAFTICWDGGRLSVGITPGEATYRWAEHTDASFWHYDDEVRLAPEEERTLPIPDRARRPAPCQPKHRAPPRRTPPGRTPPGRTPPASPPAPGGPASV
jgi:alpha,alpha-trehalose phosphorylase